MGGRDGRIGAADGADRDPRDEAGDGDATGSDSAWQYPRVVGEVDPPRRRIRVGSDLVALVDAAGAALVDAGTVYQRAGRLVDVVRQPEGPSSTTRIRGLSAASLRLRLAEAADWCRVSTGEDGQSSTVRVQPPTDLCAVLLDAGVWPLPPVLGVADGPLVRPDGTVATSTGYDPATRWWCSTDPARWLPADLSIPAACAAIGELHALLADFPVSADSDYSAALSGLLTAVCRTAIDGPVPLHLLHASTPGSGKTLWVDVCSLIATGSPAARMPPSDDEDEARKRITSILLSGSPIVLIDNVSGTLGGASLDALLTSTIWTDRILGASEMVRLPVTCSIYATGNNVSVRGDLSRRTIPCRLEPQDEHPETREGLPDLEAIARTDRDRLVRACLTVVLAYLAQPRVACRTYGSYSAWSRIAREPLIWLGQPDPLLAQDALRGIADVAVDSATGLLAALWSTFGGTEWTSRQVCAHQHGHEVRAAIEEAGLIRGREVDVRGVGYWLRRTRGRILSGMVLEEAGMAHGGVRRWQIRRVT